MAAASDTANTRARWRSDSKSEKRGCPGLPIRPESYLNIGGAPKRRATQPTGRDKPHAQSHVHACNRAAGGGIDGRWRADHARGPQHRRRRAEFHADRTGGVPGMGTPLSAGIYVDLRPVPMLVSSLSVTALPQSASVGRSDLAAVRVPRRGRHPSDRTRPALAPLPVLTFREGRF